VSPLACSNPPSRRCVAPVNAPFSWPNNSDEIRVPSRYSRSSNSRARRLTLSMLSVGRMDMNAYHPPSASSCDNLQKARPHLATAPLAQPTSRSSDQNQDAGFGLWLFRMLNSSFAPRMRSNCDGSGMGLPCAIWLIVQTPACPSHRSSGLGGYAKYPSNTAPTSDQSYSLCNTKEWKDPRVLAGAPGQPPLRHFLTSNIAQRLYKRE